MGMTLESQPIQARYYGLDGLRAIMMLLGLLLHAIISYMDTPPGGGGWTFRDPSTHVVWTCLLFFIHIFRMPIFFVMAGFFAALLYQRRGMKRMALNRFTRILVPFVVGWLILLPVTMAGFTFAFAAKASSLGEAWNVVTDSGITGYYEDSTIHLWFLYYLLLFYVAALVALPIIRRVPQTWCAWGLGIFGWVITSRLRAVWLSIPTAAILVGMGKGGALQTSVSFIPNKYTFVGYAIFFGFGCLLYQRRDLLPYFNRGAWLRVVLALILAPVNLWAVQAGLTAGDVGPSLTIVSITAASGAMIVWLLTFGLTGLFMRYLNRPIPIVRYIVDASYWLYLIHLPFTIWIPGLLVKLPWPSGVKIATLLLIATPIWLLSYDWLVRGTFIGKVLNGHRYPRGLPALQAITSAQPQPQPETT